MKSLAYVSLTLILVGACSGGAAPDFEGHDETPTTSQSRAVLATVSSDYTVGALSTVDLSTWSISDVIIPTSSDPVVVVTGGQIVQLDRYNYNTVRIYSPGDFDAPTVEFSVGDLSNPQDAEICGDELFVTLYGTNYIGIYAPDSGVLVGTVDLSAFDDGDGTPEASSMYQQDGHLLVALQRLKRLEGWIPAEGRVVEIDCKTRQIIQDWTVGNSPTVHPYPPNYGQVLVRTGVYYDAGYNVWFDGSVMLLDRISGAIQTLTTEQELQRNVVGIVATDKNRGLMLAADSSWQYAIFCVNFSDETFDLMEETSSSLFDIAMNDRQEAWIAARPGWSGEASWGGVVVYEIDACRSLTGADWLNTELPPYSIAFY